MNINNLIHETLNESGDSSKHSLTLFSLVLSLKAKNVLELGVRAGGSTKPLLQAVEFTNGILTSVDIHEDPEARKLFNSNPKWNYVIKDSIEFLSNIPTDTIYDLVLIDDWHDGLHVAKEIELIESHITPSTLILLHDCMCFEQQPNYRLYTETIGEFANGGPYAALLKLDSAAWEYSTIPVNNGLTILRKLGKTLTL